MLAIYILSLLLYLYVAVQIPLKLLLFLDLSIVFCIFTYFFLIMCYLQAEWLDGDTPSCTGFPKELAQGLYRHLAKHLDGYVSSLYIMYFRATLSHRQLRTHISEGKVNLHPWNTKPFWPCSTIPYSVGTICFIYLASVASRVSYLEWNTVAFKKIYYSCLQVHTYVQRLFWFYCITPKRVMQKMFDWERKDHITVFTRLS